MTTKIAGGEELNEIVNSPSDIAEYIERFSKPNEERLFGIEYERLGVYRDTCRAIPFDNGVEKVLDTMAEQSGWKRGLENGRIVYLERDGESITLEPGGQTEYSSAPARTVKELMKSARKAVNELDRAAEFHGIVFLGIGFHPFSKLDEISFIPKKRYSFMAPYLKKKGALALEMMKMTAGCQVALDYKNANDAMKKLRAASLVTPIAQALFASSGIGGGKTLLVLDYRASIWTQTDNARCNIPDFMLKANSDIMEYVDWLLDMPLMFIEKNGNYYESDGVSLRSLMQKKKITFYDVELAMTQAFPEVRLKRFIEIRSADSLQPALLPTVPCFWSSLIYGNLDEIFELLGKISREDFFRMREAAIQFGLKGKAGGRSIADWADDLLNIAKKSCVCDGSLKKLRERAESKITSAELAQRLLDEISDPAEFAESWNSYGIDSTPLKCDA